jgi:hypothetical protein
MLMFKLPLASIRRLALTAILGTVLLRLAEGRATSESLSSTNSPAAAVEAGPSRTNAPQARITRINGVPTMEVDGAPFFLVGAQCDIWRSLRQDEKTLAFFDGYQAMNATAVSTGIPWSKIEREKDHYDFQFLDWFIEQARQRGLKLVVNLFNSNVCGKLGEGRELVYPPDYIINAPQTYQRMVLPGPWRYTPAGPPMCPNDPRTLGRERQLCVEIAGHLARTDTTRTVIMLQIDNEFYYNQWAGEHPPDASEVRCHCQFCEKKWRAGGWKNGEDFMFHSFASYVRALTEAITAIYPLPLYVNSPWWPPRVIPIFLDNCPNLALVGIDGVFSPNEPNDFSASQVGRNLPFAAENPTENPHTRMNLDVLPYYSLIGQEGLGNLLWECGPPYTVVEDAPARQRYGSALYPIRWAQAPIAKARGTDNLLGWYRVRNIATNVTTDVFGNFVPAKPGACVVAATRMMVREGAQTRLVAVDQFAAALGELRFTVSDSTAGIIVRSKPTEWVIAVPHGRILVQGPRRFSAVQGHFDGNRWRPGGPFGSQTEGDAAVLEINEPKVLQLSVN